MFDLSFLIGCKAAFDKLILTFSLLGFDHGLVNKDHRKVQLNSINIYVQIVKKQRLSRIHLSKRELRDTGPRSGQMQ